MRRRLIAGNWKMHGSREFVIATLRELRGVATENEHVDIVVCPTLIHLSLAAELLQGSGVSLGAQNVHWEAQGAYTGEVSAQMLAEQKVQFVIVGHSERREIFGESDDMVARKFEAAQGAGLIPILCVGETLEQREAGTTHEIVISQVEAVLNLVGIDAFERAVIAYEPVWAIGTGKTATPAEAQEVHAGIRNRLISGKEEIGAGCRLLYGGSVNADNAAELFKQNDIDGGLVGGASLKVDEFAAICKSA